MTIQLIQTNGITVAHIESEAIVINHLEDALDLLGNCYYQGIEGIVMYQKNIITNFFDLKNGLAGEILQKFSTYNMNLAIVGNFTNLKSRSLSNFIYESNKMKRINFVESLEEALRVLGSR